MRWHLDITKSACDNFHMRTTLVIDDDLLQAAKSLARDRSVSIGEVISEWARRGLRTPVEFDVSPSGFPVFKVPPGARPITPEDVKQLEDEL